MPAEMENEWAVVVVHPPQLHKGMCCCLNLIILIYDEARPQHQHSGEPGYQMQAV
jgi:hypothetical protein